MRVCVTHTDIHADKRTRQVQRSRCWSSASGNEGAKSQGHKWLISTYEPRKHQSFLIGASCRTSKAEHAMQPVQNNELNLPNLILWVAIKTLCRWDLLTSAGPCGITTFRIFCAVFCRLWRAQGCVYLSTAFPLISGLQRALVLLTGWPDNCSINYKSLGDLKKYQ